MGMDYYASNAYEIDRTYARSFKEFEALESYVTNLESAAGMSDVAYLLTYDDDLWGEMDADQKQQIKDLWDRFVEAFTRVHPSASIYLEYVDDDCVGQDKPQENWYIGIMNRMIKNPDLEDLDSVIKDLSWVQLG